MSRPLPNSPDSATPAARSASPEWEQPLVGQSRAMRQIKEMVRLVAPRRATVLITGATGTGKEVIARALHEASDRRQRPMVAVNCAALPDTLLEAELFGHTKGAFTGAAHARRGCFEEAHQSTLLLDEIGEMPLDLQAKLLRVLQEREIQRLGSSETIKVDVRIIAASNVDLQEAVRRKKFRQDLYFRLNVIQIRTPSLAERLEDIPQLVAHFMRTICAQEGLSPKRVTPAALALLASHSWPGNVRELEHAVERAVTISGDSPEMDAPDFGIFPEELTQAFDTLPELMIPDSGIDFDRTIEEFQRALFLQALRKAGGNKQRAADLLGLKRTTLISRVKVLDFCA